MKSLKKRPLGVLLLTLLFLWIGCGGTILFPIFVFDGQATSLFKQLAYGVFRSEFWLSASSYAFCFLLFALYLAYAAIGIGLWKLRDWARRAVVVLFSFICIASIPVLLFRIPWQVTVPMVVGMVMPPFAWAIWYLKRPRVRFAFDAASSSVDTGNGFVPPPKLSTLGRIGVIAGAVGTFFLFLVSLSLALDEAIRTSAVYPAILEQTRNSACIASVLGAPLTPDRGLSGSFHERGPYGAANLRIPMHGPKGHGTLLVLAEKQVGVWKVTSLKLTQESEQEGSSRSVPVITCQ
jgi:hypothetical protein